VIIGCVVCGIQLGWGCVVSGLVCLRSCGFSSGLLFLAGVFWPRVSIVCVCVWCMCFVCVCVGGGVCVRARARDLAHLVYLQ